MKSSQRAIFAAIAAAVVNGRASQSIYDYSAGEHVHTQISINGQNVTAYDFRRGVHVTGPLSALFDFGEGQHVQFNRSGNRITGFDYGSGQHFQIDVNGRQLQFFDYDGSGYHQFTV